MTLPLSRQGMLAGAAITALPMFGDYYTNTLLSASPRTNMIGNQIQNAVQTNSTRGIGAALVIVLTLLLTVLMFYYLYFEQRRGEGAPMKRLVGWWKNPWRKPHILAAITWLYLLWALVPVLIAIQFSFNKGRSRSTWQGFSWRWYWGDPSRSVWHDPTLHRALFNSLWLAGMTMLVCAPLGVALALGLTRWRGYGQRPANFLQLIPLVTPRS